MRRRGDIEVLSEMDRGCVVLNLMITNVGDAETSLLYMAPEDEMIACNTCYLRLSLMCCTCECNPFCLNGVAQGRAERRWQKTLVVVD